MSIRRKALEALSQIIDGGAYANLCLKKAEEGLDERDAKWISAAVYSALDNLMMIDLIIACHAKGKLDKTIRNILRLGVCQARYMLVPESAACNESVKLAKEVGKGALSGSLILPSGSTSSPERRTYSKSIVLKNSMQPFPSQRAWKQSIEILLLK